MSSGPNFEWETTKFRSGYTQGYGDEPASVTDSFLHDCKVLVQEMERRKSEELEDLQDHLRRTAAVADTLKPGPLPMRKEPRKPLNPAYVVAGIVCVFLIAGYELVKNPAFKAHTEELIASTSDPGAGYNSTEPGTGPQAVPEASETPAGTAPYSMPSSPAPANPPPIPASSQESEQESLAYVPNSTASQTPAAPASQAGRDEVIRWADEVRKNPGDVNARRELSHAYLVAGDANSSIEQFYAVMKLSQVSSDDIITYANNLQVFGSKETAKQFLANILRSDPGQTAIRQRLSELNGL